MSEIVNGDWIVLSTKPRDEECEYVICLIPGQYGGDCIDKHDQFSVHTRRCDNPQSLFWGHYFPTVELACEYFTSRVSRLKEFMKDEPII